MGYNPLTKDFFLWSMSCIYLIAFASLYVQIPGLYGDVGILPAKLVVKDVPKTLEDFAEQPTLLRLLPYVRLDTQTGMDLICLLGMFISFLCFVHKGSRDMLSFALLWIFYHSLFQVGQTFLWFQWDILLMETGFLCILIAPLQLRLLWWQTSTNQQHDSITMYLIKWLLFRLMFASGVVKLTSQCPTWWGLTALNWHFESQCIPTPLAWYFHQLPEWFLKFGVVMTYVIEISIPFLFFAPVRSLRIFAFYMQIFFQVLIFITGNYNFFNLLTMVLCVSLLDDQFLLSCSYKYKSKVRYSVLESIPYLGYLLRIFKKLFVLATYVYIVMATIRYFSLKLNTDDYSIESKTAFSKEDFNKFLEKVVPYTIYIGGTCLVIEILLAVMRSIQSEGIFQKIWSILGCLVFGAAAIGMFGLSLVPFTPALDQKSSQLIHPKFMDIHKNLGRYRLTSSYGLFRRMTGVGGRPEVVFEGSQKLESGWKEYQFFYKPGNLSARPSIVAPHQPRLDWQMWFAALGTYQQNLWFVNLAYRIVTAEPDVMELIQHNPFPNKPPKYVRATLYHYHYTRIDPAHKRHSLTDWWWRESKGEYLPPITKDEPTLLNYLKHEKIIRKDPVIKQDPTFIKIGLNFVRSHVRQMEGFTFVSSVLIAALVVRIFTSWLSK